MAITTAQSNQSKQDFLDAVHAPADVYKLVLIKPGAVGTYDATTATYAGAGSMADEVATGGAYVQGGITLTGRTSALTAGVGSLDFADVAVSASTISAIGAMIVNTSKSNKVLSVHDFGGTIASTNDIFTVTIPAAGVGVIRYS